MEQDYLFEDAPVRAKKKRPVLRVTAALLCAAALMLGSVYAGAGIALRNAAPYGVGIEDGTVYGPGDIAADHLTAENATSDSAF